MGVGNSSCNTLVSTAKQKASEVSSSDFDNWVEEDHAGGDNSDGNKSAETLAPINKFPVVEDVTRSASEEEKNNWYNFWERKWTERLNDEYHFTWSEEVLNANMKAQAEGEILGINGDGINYFFTFLDCNGYCFKKEDWDILGTDISHAWDVDNEFLKSMTDPCVLFSFFFFLLLYE